MKLMIKLDINDQWYTITSWYNNCVKIIIIIIIIASLLLL